MLCNELTNALTRLATRIAKVCCDRQLLVYSANLVILAVVFVRHEIFLACFAPHRLLHSQTTAPLRSRLLSYATDGGLREWRPHGGSRQIVRRAERRPLRRYWSVYTTTSNRQTRRRRRLYIDKFICRSSRRSRRVQCHSRDNLILSRTVGILHQYHRPTTGRRHRRGKNKDDTAYAYRSAALGASDRSSCG